MIETTNVWEAEVDPSLRKKYGSKRSGTVYIAASSLTEARQIVNELYEQHGLKAPTSCYIEQTHLVSKVLRMIY